MSRPPARLTPLPKDIGPLSSFIDVDEVGRQVQEDAFWSQMERAIRHNDEHVQEMQEQYAPLVEKLTAQHSTEFSDPIFLGMLMKRYFAYLNKIDPRITPKVFIVLVRSWLK